MRALLLGLVLVVPAFAGCLSGDAPEGPTDVVASSAEEAGARAGPAPAGATGAYRVAAADASGAAIAATAYPVPLTTNPARDPVHVDFSGVYERADCAPQQVGGVNQRFRFFDLSEHLQVGDVFSYEVVFAFQNAGGTTADLHMGYAIGSRVEFNTDFVADRTDEVRFNYTGQSMRVSDDDAAGVWVICFFGLLPQPVPFTLTVDIRFAESAVPAETPFLLSVPDNATKLFARGVALDSSKGVNSHYRLFGPDDELVCECSLQTSDQDAAFELPGPGDYVILVDHTDNGFVSFALDAPSDVPIRPLETEWTAMPLLKLQNGQNVDVIVDFELDRVPLVMFAWTRVGDPSGAGMGRNVVLSVSNERGEVLRQGQGAFVSFQLAPLNFGMWQGLQAAGWDRMVDHHRYGPGAHQLHFTAEHFTGEAFVGVRQYVR